MAIKGDVRAARQQRRLRKQVCKVARTVDSMSFFNLLTGPELLEKLDKDPSLFPDCIRLVAGLAETSGYTDDPRDCGPNRAPSIVGGIGRAGRPGRRGSLA